MGTLIGKFNNLKIGVKLMAGFLVVVVLTVVVGVIGMSGLTKVSDAEEKADYANVTIQHIGEIRKSEKNYVIRGDDKYIDAIRTELVAADELLTEWKSQAHGDREAKIDGVIGNFDEYEQAMGAFVDLQNQYVAAQNTMIEKARAAEKEATDSRQSQQEQLAADLQALENGTTTLEKVQDRIGKAKATDELLIAMGELRVAEKNFLSRHDSQYVSEFEDKMEATLAMVDATRAKMKQQININQMNEMESALKDYAEALALSASTYEQQQDKLAVMEDAGRYVAGSTDPSSEYYGGAALLGELAKHDSSSAKSSATTTSIVICVIAAVCAVILGFFLSRSISNAAKRMTGVARQIAETDLSSLANVSAAIAKGDLTQSVTLQAKEIDAKSGDEMGDLARAFNQMITRLRETGQAFDEMTHNLNGLIGKVSENSAQLNEASSQLASAANQAGQASQQVASTSQDMAKGSGEQAEMLQGSAASMKQLEQIVDQVAKGSASQSIEISKAHDAVQSVSAAVDQVAKSAVAVAEGSRSAADMAVSGADKTRKTVEGMARVQLSFNDASDKVSDLGRRSEEIGRIVAVIDDIAAQTNLLALNAAIEAARAGEHGLGFAVVSDEVRKLAERTASATKEIADLVTGVQRGVADGIKAMQEGGNQVKDGYALATESGESLEQIQKAVKDVSEQIGQISSAAEEMSAAAIDLVTMMDAVGSVVEQNTAAAQQMSSAGTEVGSAIENAAGISQQSSAATEQLSASAQEMGAQVEEIVASSHSLNEMARILRESVAQFKVRSNGTKEKVLV